MSFYPHAEIEVQNYGEPQPDDTAFMKRLRGARTIVVKAGIKKDIHIDSPLGGFDREEWPVEVQVYISPTGRSVRVWVNNERVST